MLLAVQVETGFAAEPPAELFAPLERWLAYDTIDDARSEPTEGPGAA